MALRDRSGTASRCNICPSFRVSAVLISTAAVPNFYKVYSAKCLKKTRLIYECPSTFALASDSHEILYLYWIKIELKTSIFLCDLG